MKSALSMLIMALVASACQMQPWVDSRSFGFYCKSSDTFLFMVSSSAFLSSFLMLVCCMLSKKTENRLLSTSYDENVRPLRDKWKQGMASSVSDVQSH
ncbi:MARVEL domain-containing protein [Caerostris extrusa]|uniref:MARVEL domain-containing protein n=1 Tax=Caerostris extrusa TaxID=172846 RepID=A0AAV4UHH4_CAEEX|nr:MARVEL domain-containing protein [Caerostris extrusa]